MNDTAHTPIDKWNHTSVSDELYADAAHVWRASLDQPTDVMKIVKKFHKNTVKRKR